VRGFLSGGFWGILLGGVTVAGVSLVGEQPARNDPPASPQISAPAVQNDTTQTVVPAIGTVAETIEPTDAPAPLAVPVAADSNVSNADTAPITETTSAALPSVGNVADGIAVPVENKLADLGVTGEVPVLPNPQSVAPQAPRSERAIVVDTVSADPLPEVAPAITDDAPVAEAAPQEGSVSPDVAAVVDASPLAPQSPLAPAAPETGDTANIVGTTTPQEPESATVDDAPTFDEAPVVVTIVDDAAAALPTNTPGVRMNRLSVNDDAIEDADETLTAEDFPEGTPALVRFAADGSNLDGRPEMSVILIDDGSFDGAVTAVAGVAFPISVMLNPSMPNATERMKAYRAAGIEVGVLATLPDSATATDVAVFFEAAFTTLPETVAVLDAGGASLQSGSDVIGQAIMALSEEGRGLVTVSRGLNTGLRAAAEQGVPTGIIFRNLDDEDQDARVIRRFMDQAAFRARQESGVVLLGQIRGETISALIQWGAANRASQVALVPVSKVLIGE
jgi:polysaccharide deacetylase 2 family uncharacterized protein YibQ